MFSRSREMPVELTEELVPSDLDPTELAALSSERVPDDYVPVMYQLRSVVIERNVLISTLFALFAVAMMSWFTTCSFRAAREELEAAKKEYAEAVSGINVVKSGEQLVSTDLVVSAGELNTSASALVRWQQAKGRCVDATERWREMFGLVVLDSHHGCDIRTR